MLRVYFRTGTVVNPRVHTHLLYNAQVQFGGGRRLGNLRSCGGPPFAVAVIHGGNARSSNPLKCFWGR